MKCPVCGTKNDKTAVRCRACGHPLGVAPGKSAKPVAASSRTDTTQAQPRRRHPSGAGSMRPPDSEKTADAKKKALSFAITFSGILVFVAIGLLKNMDDSPIKEFYFILVAAASVLIPIAQAIAQRRLAAGDYRENLDNMYDALENTIHRLLDPAETIVDVSFSMSLKKKKASLLLLAQRRFVWMDSSISDDSYIFDKAFAVDLDDITAVKYSGFTGSLSVKSKGGRIPTFTLTPAREAASFAAELERSATSAARSRSSSGKPVYALCSECGTEIDRKKNLCPLHENK